MTQINEIVENQIESFIAKVTEARNDNKGIEALEATFASLITHMTLEATIAELEIKVTSMAEEIKEKDLIIMEKDAMIEELTPDTPEETTPPDGLPTVS